MRRQLILISISTNSYLIRPFVLGPLGPRAVSCQTVKNYRPLLRVNSCEMSRRNEEEKIRTIVGIEQP